MTTYWTQQNTVEHQKAIHEEESLKISLHFQGAYISELPRARSE